MKFCFIPVVTSQDGRSIPVDILKYGESMKYYAVYFCCFRAVKRHRHDAVDGPESPGGRCWLAVVRWSTASVCELESKYLMFFLDML